MMQSEAAVAGPSPSDPEITLAATEEGIIADEGPFTVDGWYVPDNDTRWRVRWNLVRALTERAQQLRAWARGGSLPPGRAAVPLRLGVLRCAYCTRVIAGGESYVLLAGARIRDSAAHPCYARYGAEFEAWDVAQVGRSALALSIGEGARHD